MMVSNLNPLRADPSRTGGLRRRLVAEIRRRFKKVRKAILALVEGDDAFGLAPDPRLPAAFFVGNATRQWQFRSSPEQVAAFRAWLKATIGRDLTGGDEEALWSRYVEEGLRQGAGRSFDDVTRRAVARGGPAPPPGPAPLQATISPPVLGQPPAPGASRQEFLRTAFRQPVAVEKVKVLAARSFDDLEGVTTEMGARINRRLADGLVRGESPRKVARELVKEVDVSQRRAEAIARMEILRAHAEGQLMALEQMGVAEVGALVEWNTAGDHKVCPKCKKLEGKLFTIAEARGMLPLHVSCRCAWTPHIS